MNQRSKKQNSDNLRKTMKYVRKKTHYIEQNQSYKKEETKLNEKEDIFLDQKPIHEQTLPSK